MELQPGPVRAKVAELKAKHDELLYVRAGELEDIHILYKPLSLQEFNRFIQLKSYDSYGAENYLVDCTLLYLYDEKNRGDKIPAGAIPWYIEQIIPASGWGATEPFIEKVDLYRQNVRGIELAAIAFICKAFPRYVPEDVRAMTSEAMAERLAMAELILETPFQIAKPKDEKTEQRKNKDKIFQQAKDNDKLVRPNRSRTRRNIDMSKENSGLTRMNRG